MKSLPLTHGVCPSSGDIVVRVELNGKRSSCDSENWCQDSKREDLGQQTQQIPLPLGPGQLLWGSSGAQMLVAPEKGAPGPCLPKAGAIRVRHLRWFWKI